jgi:hypothetical protein
MSASKLPSLMRVCGLVALSKIALTSASVLLPANAARTRKARWVSSGMFRTVMDDIKPPWVISMIAFYIN